MAYLGNNLQVAYSAYLVIDNIASGFNGSTTSFALTVNGIAPVPFPRNPQNCLISVGGVTQQPDSTGANGFTFSGTNIVFSSAPSTGEKFWGVILAGADYVNVGANFPSGTAAVPSVTFDESTGTGLFLASSNVLGITTGGVQRLVINSSGFVGIGTTSPAYALDIAAADTTAGIGYAVRLRANSTAGAAAIQFTNASGLTQAFAIAADTSNNLKFLSDSNVERARIDSSGRLLVGPSTARAASGFSSNLQMEGTSYEATSISLIRNDGAAALNSPSIIFGRSGGAANGSVIAVGNGDRLGAIAFTGANGTNLTNLGGLIECYVDGTVTGGGANDMPGRLVFSTTADGAASPTERIRIDSGGLVNVKNNLQVFAASSSDYAIINFYNCNGGIKSGKTTGGTGTDRIVLSGDSVREDLYVNYNGSVVIPGSLSKGSGSFRIDHPLPEKTNTHQLVHSFIEGPQADLIYRGHITLVNGTAQVNIDEAGRMTQGTFEALCTNVCCFTSNETNWTPVRGHVDGNVLTIEAQDATSTAEVCWLVIGERKDRHMLDTDWTDETGRVITEPLKAQPTAAGIE